MTFEQYVDFMLMIINLWTICLSDRGKSASTSMRLRLRIKHAALVKEALMNAEPVPEKVVREYPELWSKRIRGGDNLLL